MTITAHTYVGKGDFVRCPLMQEQATVRFVKQKDGKGSMQDTVWLLLAKDVRFLLGRRAHHLILVIDHHDGIAFHEIVLGEAVVGPVVVVVAVVVAASRSHAV